jgi:hypothetical protein
LTSTGVPFLLLTTTLPMSSSECSRPTPRTTYDCSPRSMTLPPPLALLALMASMTCASVSRTVEPRGVELQHELRGQAAEIVTSTTPRTCFRRGITTQNCSSDSSRRLRWDSRV